MMIDLSVIVGEIAELTADNNPLDELLQTWVEQVDHIGKVSAFWLDFSIICGCIGLALSIVAAILLIKKIKEGEK